MNRVQSDSYWYDAGYKTARKETVDKVLDILDKVSSDSSSNGEYWNSAKTIMVLRRRIMTLKESEQE